MRTLIILTFSILTSLNLQSQNISIVEVENRDQSSLLMSIRGVKQFNTERSSIKIIEREYITSKEIVGLEGQDVIICKLFISIQLLTNEDQTFRKSYWVDGNFYNPREYSYLSTTKKLTFNHGTKEQIKSSTFVITETGLEIE
ncbi:MAG: hypothetical protein RIF39_07275 [Cyclobacteriaceae bacterium]